MGKVLYILLAICILQVCYANAKKNGKTSSSKHGPTDKPSKSSDKSEKLYLHRYYQLRSSLKNTFAIIMSRRNEMEEPSKLERDIEDMFDSELTKEAFEKFSAKAQALAKQATSYPTMCVSGNKFLPNVYESWSKSLKICLEMKMGRVERLVHTVRLKSFFNAMDEVMRECDPAGLSKQLPACDEETKTMLLVKLEFLEEEAKNLLSTIPEAHADEGVVTECADQIEGERLENFTGCIKTLNE